MPSPLHGKSSHSLVHKIFVLSILIIVLLAGAEVALRLLGFPTYSSSSFEQFVRVDPPGKMFQPHPVLGFTHVEGQQHLEAYQSVKWTQTHNADLIRIMPEAANAERDVWIFGCSFTHGYGVNDDDPYPRLLQDALRGCRVINFGTDGYGTVQMLLQYRLAKAARPKPSVVIVAHIGEHYERDALSPSRRKIMALATGPQFRNIPFAEIGADGSLVIKSTPMTYQAIPGARYFALMNLIDAAKLSYLPPDSKTITERVIQEFANEVTADGTEFVVAGVRYDAEPIMEYCDKHQIKCIRAWFNSNDVDKVMTVFDDHPTASAHKDIMTYLANGLYDQGILKDNLPVNMGDREMAQWELQGEDAPFAHLTRQGPNCRVDVKRSTKNESWRTKLEMTKLFMRKDYRYRYQFTIRSKNPRPVSVAIYRSRPPWELLHKLESFITKAGSEPHLFQLDLVSETDEPNYSFAVQLGESTDSVEVSPLRIENLGPIENRQK